MSANTYLPPVIFIPSTLIIQSITRTFPMVVTCSVPSTGSNTYQANMLVKFFIPSSYGMQQLAGRTEQIYFVAGLNFTFNIDATQFDPFIIPAAGQPQPASISPAGSRNLTYNNFTSEVAFQPLNNIGN